MNRLTRIGLLILATAAACCSALMLAAVVVQMRFPYAMDYEEGNILNTAVRMARGLSAYPDPHGWPRILNPYGPVTYVISAACVRLFGVEFVASRVMVVIAAIAVVVLMALIVRSVTGSTLIGVAFALLYLCDGGVNFWMPLLRADFIGIAFTLAGLWMVLKGRPVSAAVLFVLAVFTKHTLIAAPMASFVWLMLERERKAAVRLAVSGVVIGGAAFGLMQLMTHGWFAFYMFGTHADPFSWGWAFGWMGLLLQLNALPVVLTLALIARDVWRRKASLLSVYVVIAVAMVITGGKLGSNSNHLLEATAALLMAAGEGWSVLTTLPDRAKIIALVTAVLLGYVALGNVNRLHWPQEFPGCDQAIRLMKSAKGDLVISDNMGAAVQAGKTLVVSNPFVYTQLVEHGGWSDDDLVQLIRAKSLAMIMMAHVYRQEWSPRVMHAIAENYRQVPGCECPRSQMVFVPR